MYEESTFFEEIQEQIEINPKGKTKEHSPGTQTPNGPGNLRQPQCRLLTVRWEAGEAGRRLWLLVHTWRVMEGVTSQLGVCTLRLKGRRQLLFPHRHTKKCIINNHLIKQELKIYMLSLRMDSHVHSTSWSVCGRSWRDPALWPVWTSSSIQLMVTWDWRYLTPAAEQKQ